jgi:putative sugar O-methyltransferase
MNNYYGWRASEHHANEYVKSIKTILENKENINSFRGISNTGYSTILEHLNERDGKKYYEMIRKDFNNDLQLINKFILNDQIGNPIKFRYDDFYINPTTLRYSYVALDLKKTFGDLNNYNYVEIGAGYGGQLTTLSSIYSFKSATLFDIPDAMLLQNEYLSKFNIKADFFTIDHDFKIPSDSIVVSNYAWCELNDQYRKIYMDKIINKCKYAYLTVYDINIEKEFAHYKNNISFTTDEFNGCTIVKIKNQG